MEKAIDFIVRDVLIFTASLTIILITGSFLKWYVDLRRRTRRIFYHLRNYKRPSYLPILGHAWKFSGTPTQIHNSIHRASLKYGPNFVVWLIDKVILCIGKPEDIETVLQSQKCVEKNELYRFTWDIVGWGLFSAPVDKWRKNRKIITPTFNARILEGYQPVFGNSASYLVDEILPKYVNKKEVAWLALFTSVNLEIIAETAMGVKIHTQKINLPFGDWLDEGMRAIFVRMLTFYYFPDFIFFRTKLGKQLLEAKKKIHEFTEKIITGRRQKFKEDLENGKYRPVFDVGPQKIIGKKAFLDCLLELDYMGMKFTDKELRDEINTFFVGGTDTTAITSCFFMTMMGMHPEIQEKVYEEVMAVLGPDRLPTVQDLNELHLTERCIKETLRLFTPAPLILRTNTGGDLKLSEGVFPVGASCCILMFYLHRSELYWKDPLKFDPDRFLSEEVLKRHPYSFIPFSAGLRGCVGQRFAFTNLKTTLSIIIRKYKIFCDAYKSIEDIKVKNFMVLRPIDGFKFYMENRQMST